VWRALGGSAGVSYYLELKSGYCALPNGASGCACDVGQQGTRLTEHSGSFGGELYICSPANKRLVFGASYNSAPGYPNGFRQLNPGECMELYPNRGLASCECKDKTLAFIGVNRTDDMHLAKAYSPWTSGVPYFAYLFTCSA